MLKCGRWHNFHSKSICYGYWTIYDIRQLSNKMCLKGSTANHRISCWKSSHFKCRQTKISRSISNRTSQEVAVFTKKWLCVVAILSAIHSKCINLCLMLDESAKPSYLKWFVVVFASCVFFPLSFFFTLIKCPTECRWLHSNVCFWL